MHYTEAAETLAGLFPATKAKFRACYRKCAYPDLGQALVVKERRERQTGMVLYLYACPFADGPGGHWHLSRKEPSSAEIQARLDRLCESIQSAGNELRRMESDLRAIQRQYEAVKSAIRRRAKRIEWARSVATLTALYAEQRRDVTRAVALSDEEADLALAHNSLLFSLQSVREHGGARTSEDYRAYVAQLMAFERETERLREENAAFLAESLAGLDAQEQRDIAWIREQINQRYALPTMPWKASCVAVQGTPGGHACP